jgi:hypothetical protein
MNIETKVKGIINIQVKRNGVVRHDVTFENLILDTFFARFAANNTLIAPSAMQCRIGTGTTTPANGDTALVSQIATRTQTGNFDVAGALDVPNNRHIVSVVRQFEFVQGTVVANLAEIGFEFAPGSGGISAGSLNSRSLTKDSFGTPTAIPVTADDQLIINYTLRAITPLTDYAATINLSGIDYDVLGRFSSAVGVSLEQLLGYPNNGSQASSFGSASTFGAHGAIPTSPSGTVTTAWVGYPSVSGGKEFELTASINQFNATGGVKCISIPMANTSNVFKYEFTPVLPKTNLKVLKLRFRMTCVRG